MLIDIQLIGIRELTAKLSRMPVAVQDRLRPFMATATIELREAVRANIRRIFHEGTPKLPPQKLSLEGGLTSNITESPGNVTGRVAVEGVPWARIQEYGGRTPPHVILPKRAAVLAFLAPGKLPISKTGGNGLVFAKKVNHPGSNIPERSYARTALVAYRSRFDGGIRQIVGEAIRQ